MQAALLKAFGILLLLAALGLTLSRAPDRPVETLVARWAPPPSDFVELDGQVVHFRDEGPSDDPLPVVLLHGTSSSLHTWEGWVRALRGQRRVVTMDLPGFGLTGPRADADYTTAADARFVLALLDKLGIRRFVVGGNSLGGEIAWRIALLVPARVDRLILVDALGSDVEPRSLPIAWRIAMLPVIGSLLDEVLPRPLVTQGLVTAYGHPEKITDELVDRYYELALRTGNRRALIRRLATPRTPADPAALASLRMPTLILWGGQDRVIPPAAAARFQAAIPGSRLVVFDDLGHMPQEEDAARSVQPVLAFLGLR